MKHAFSTWSYLCRAVQKRLATPSKPGTRSSKRPRLERLESRLAPAGHDTLTAAISLTLDYNQPITVNGALADPNQVDLYAVPLHAGDEVNVDVSAPIQGSPASCLRVFKSSGQQLAFQENSGNADTQLTFDALSSGSYYVGVSSNGNFSYNPNGSGSGRGGLSTGSYTLSLTLSSIVVTENPTNYSLRTAQTITGNTGQPPTIAGDMALQGTYVSGTTEYYSFAVAATGGLTAAVTPAAGTAFLPRLTLYGASGQLLIQSDAAGPGNASAQLNQNLQPGSYDLAVSAVPDSGSVPGNQPYLLTTQFAAAAPPFQPLPTVGSLPQSVAEGDFNHDGNLDLVTADSFDSFVSVFLGNGNGTFQPAVTYSVTDNNSGTGFNPDSVAVGDFRQDGNLDLVTANPGDETVSVLLGNGDGTFQPPTVYSVGE